MSKFDDLMQTSMTRRQFLKTLGTGLAVLIGLPAILRVLDYQGFSSNQMTAEGYGAGAYGGVDPRHHRHSFGKSN